MSRVVYKWPLQIGAVTKITYHGHLRPLHVGFQSREPFIWCEHSSDGDLDISETKLEFLTVGTGWTLEEYYDSTTHILVYFDSIVSDFLVWHVYQLIDAKPANDQPKYQLLKNLEYYGDSIQIGDNLAHLGAA